MYTFLYLYSESKTESKKLEDTKMLWIILTFFLLMVEGNVVKFVRTGGKTDVPCGDSVATACSMLRLALMNVTATSLLVDVGEGVFGGGPSVISTATAVTVRGAGASKTALQSSNLDCITLEGDASLTLQGVTVRNAEIGLELQNTGNVTVRSCTFDSNGRGVASTLQFTGHLHISETLFNANNFRGGAEHSRAIDFQSVSATLTVVDSAFTSNMTEKPKKKQQ